MTRTLLGNGQRLKTKENLIFYRRDTFENNLENDYVCWKGLFWSDELFAYDLRKKGEVCDPKNTPPQ